jgi:ribose transport system permease protein
VSLLAPTPAPLEESSPRPARSRAWARLKAAQRSMPIAQGVALVLLYAYGAATLQGFTAATSIKALLVLASLLGLAAVGQTVVVLLGGLDLSIAGIITLADVLFAVLSGKGWAFIPALAVVLAIAIFLGAANGYICARFRIQPIVVTIAIGFIATGLAQVEVSNFTVGSVPAWLSRFSSATGTTFGIGLPPVIVMWGVVAVIVGTLLACTRLGRRVYQTGSNPAAAELALINTRRVWTGAFALSAGCAAVVGVLLAGFSGSADATVGTQYLFTSLAAVIVGGTSIAGARGDYWRTVLGALIITVLSTVLLGHGYSIGDQQIAFGLAILVVVAGYGRDARLRDRV